MKTMNVLMPTFTNPISELFLSEAYPSSTTSYDVYDTDNRRVVEFLIPGFDKEDLNLQLINGILGLRGVKKKPEENRKYVYKNIKTPSEVNVSIGVGRQYDIDSAKYAEGVLRVFLKRNDTRNEGPSFPIS